MDGREVEIRQHRRSWIRWRTCGFRWPCAHRQLLLDERTRDAASAAVAWYPVYFRRRGAR
jgi:hypothetical protein